ncbi:hypothetical protein, conserved [Plasmodium vivax]|uniref:Dynein intermediate chain n=1 Tax=Plasmodium vivax (strain Salvador I) TaxID=126793 RepID=A5KDS8_PLAVS|nr:hypothetical protein, conserved [Plasmodium vivax]EDL42374.1 hypothetical protein, conserved [Plasmodium vivax]|eukprot:XP_001608398.1 hypothetical protein [Plasmodium vivax Sal-1]
MKGKNAISNSSEKKIPKKKKDSEKTEHGRKEHLKKKNDMSKKKVEIDTKNKLEKVDSKSKNEIDVKSKNERGDNEEKKKTTNETKKRNENDTRVKGASADKKQHTLKNRTLSDLGVAHKETENFADAKAHPKNANLLISAVNVELEKDVKSLLGIDFCNDFSTLIFKNSQAACINKNYFFSLAQKYLTTDEFLPVKNDLTKYKLDDVLIFKDSKKYYKGNHAVVVDEEIFSYFLQKGKHPADPPADQNGEDKQELSCVFIKPKNYLSLYEQQIEQEIKSTRVTENRKKFKKCLYISKRKKVGAEVQFTQYDQFIPIRGNEPTTSAVQAKTLDFFSNNSITHEEKNCQTYKAVYKNLGVQYNIDFLKKKKEEIFRSNKLQKFLHKLFPIMEKCLIENSLITESNGQPFAQNIDILSFKHAKKLNKIFIYTDVKYTTDKVVLFTLSLSLINYLIFIIYVNNYKNDNFIEGVNTDSYILIWSYSNYINPLYALISPYQISSAVVNEKGYDVVIAGCSNGLLVVWKLPPNFQGRPLLDSKINEKTVDIEPYIFSSIEHSHKREVTSLLLLNDKTLVICEKKISINNQKNYHLLISISVDGTILLWDATNVEIIEVKVSAKKKEKELIDDLYSFKPLFKINSTRPNTEYSLGFTYFHFVELNCNVSSFFAFSEEGEYVVGNIYGCMQKEKNYSIINKINDDYKSFKTLICVKRNSIIKYLILTLTDTNFSLWKENEEHPLYVSPKSNEIYSCCEFSQTKISVIFVGKINGHIEIWNLMEQKNHCMYSLSISSYSLTCISIFQNCDSSIFSSVEKKNNVQKDPNEDLSGENSDTFVDTNDYLMSKNEDDVYKYSYNKIIIGDSSGCVFVYEMEENLLNSTKEEIDEFLLWVENKIYVNKEKVKRHLQLCEEREKLLRKEEQNTNERKEQLKNKLDEDYKNALEKYRGYLLGNKL